MLRMIARLQDPNIEYRQLEEIIAQDVTLGYKLLRLSNSVVFGTAAKITSIPHAMAMIGMRQLKGWLTLFLLSEIDDKPREVTTIAMTRARMCEKIGIQLGERSGEAHFLVGLFSVLDALMDLPIEEVISTLNLSDVIADALIHRRGKLGQALDIVLDYEHGNWDKLDSVPIEPSVLRNIYLEAIEWIAKLNASVLVNR
ncbi:MAG TPA: HDOD domain-containing protein [Anaerolineaceae bacterium]